MAFIDLGKLKFNWQGEWSASTNYEVDDVVFYDSHSYVCTSTHSATGTVPSGNLTVWDLMSAGVHFREDGDWSAGGVYYRNDLVRYNSALYLLTGANDSTGQTPGSSPWSLFQAAPAGNVMNSIGAMEYRNNENATTELVINPTVNKGLTVQEQPRETYSSRAFNYEEDGDYGKSLNTAGSIPVATYTQNVTAQRSGSSYADGSYIITGESRTGVVTKKQDPTLTINIGDTIVFNNSTGSHPLDIVDAAVGGSQVTTGTLTGAGVAGTVTWVTNGVAAGTYYYQCTAHPGMVGEIVVVDTTNPQGSSTANGVIDVCRGKSYTITFSSNLSSGQNYDIYSTAGGHSTANDSLTAAEGNGAWTNSTTSGVTWTSGSTQTITFTPNETTPNTVYIGNRNIAMTNNLVINVHDVAYVPSWGTAAAPAAAPGAVDAREFKHWQDWYGGDAADQNNGYVSTWGYVLPAATRDPGEDVEVGGNPVGAQQRRLWRGSSNSTDWTVPDGVEKVRITCIGGGGGGGCNTGHYYAGSGGGGGAFTSAEYTVSEGDVLRVTVGHGGYGFYSSSGNAGSGGTTTVYDLATGGANISLSAEGGTGGQYYGMPTPMPGGASEGGNNIVCQGSSQVAGTVIRSAGGHGGSGSDHGYAWGPENYVAGGGGSAGSMYGNGHPGGSGYQYRGGYFVGQSGGGGIGGHGGDGEGNYYPGTYGPTGAASGGGSIGPGRNGKCEFSNQNGYPGYYGGVEGAEGGEGIADSIYDSVYTDHNIRVAGYNPTVLQWTEMVNHDQSASNYTLTTDAYNAQCGARYGDGEATNPANGWDTSYHKGDPDNAPGFERQKRENQAVGHKHANNTVTYSAKAFNGVLGRLWGGGGAGGGGTSAWYYSFPGGEGGSGAGGGGGMQYTTSAGPNLWQGVNNSHQEWSVWDVANMAWRMHDKFRTSMEQLHPGLVTTGSDYNPLHGGSGGHGGALGGGGGGGAYGSCGGYGGIGGGGGGASSTYNPPYYGQGGHGGIGYVLIEWE